MSARQITFRAVTLSVSGWAAVNGLPEFTIRRRLRAGWPEHFAITVPAGTRFVDAPGVFEQLCQLELELEQMIANDDAERTGATIRAVAAAAVDRVLGTVITEPAANDNDAEQECVDQVACECEAEIARELSEGKPPFWRDARIVGRRVIPASLIAQVRERVGADTDLSDVVLSICHEQGIKGGALWFVDPNGDVTVLPIAGDA